MENETANTTEVKDNVIQLGKDQVINETGGGVPPEVAKKLDELTRDSIRKTYQYHKPGEEGLAKIQELRRCFSMLHDIVEGICPVSRERSTAVTQLETAAMWAIKAVVINDTASEVMA